MESNKPIVLGVIGAVLVVAAWTVQTYLVSQYSGMAPLMYCLYSMAVPVLLWMLVDGVLQYRSRDVEILDARQRALSMSTMSMTLDAARQVHPEVLAMILGERARRWGLISGTKSRDKSPYSVLNSRPQVTDRFVAHVLKMSNKKGVMPKRLLSDKDKSFDPQGIVTAYEMYDAFHSLLEEEMKLTRPFGDNKPGYWMSGWDPDSVAADFGIDLEDYDFVMKVADLNPQLPVNVQSALQDLEPVGDQ